MNRVFTPKGLETGNIVVYGDSQYLVCETINDGVFMFNMFSLSTGERWDDRWFKSLELLYKEIINEYPHATVYKNVRMTIET